jgi:hypothetical protein
MGVFSVKQETLNRPARGMILMKRSGRAFVAISAMTAIAFAAGTNAWAAAQQSAPSAAAVFEGEANKLGASRCASLFSGLGNGLTAGSAFAVKTEVGAQPADAHAMQGVVGMTYNTPGFKGQAAGIIFAAPTGGACEGNLVRVAPYRQSCREVVGLLPAGTTAGDTLSGVPTYNLGGNQGLALLLPSGSSCVVVSVARSVAL